MLLPRLFRYSFDIQQARQVEDITNNQKHATNKENPTEQQISTQTHKRQKKTHKNKTGVHENNIKQKLKKKKKTLC